MYAHRYITSDLAGSQISKQTADVKLWPNRHMSAHESKTISPPHVTRREIHAYRGVTSANGTASLFHFPSVPLRLLLSEVLFLPPNTHTQTSPHPTPHTHTYTRTRKRLVLRFSLIESLVALVSSLSLSFNHRQRGVLKFPLRGWCPSAFSVCPPLSPLATAEERG